MYDMVHILTSNGEVTIDDTNVVILTDMESTNLNGTDSGGDFSRLDTFDGIDHSLTVRLKIGFRIEANERGNTLWQCFTWHDAGLLLCKSSDLLGAENDITIVGKNNDTF